MAPRILVVEDDPVNLMVITRMLDRLGHSPDVARNGREAVEAASRTAYDIIFMDLMMPELDGIQAARSIRIGAPSAPPMIFAVTANVMPEDKRAALDAGMNDYVTKPIRMDTIRALVESGATPEDDALDAGVLEELRETMGDPEFFAELLSEFVANSDELVSDIERGVESDDLDSVATAAHTLKSTAAAFGGTSLTDTAKDTEDAVRNGARRDLPALARRVRSERDRLCRLLQS